MSVGGLVVALEANFCRVALEAAGPGGVDQLLCVRRTRLGKTGQQICVGDRVTVEGVDWVSRRGAVAAVASRSSLLARPAVANCNRVVVVMALVLAGLYENFTDPLIILVTVPLALLGAALGLMLRQLPLDVYGQMGLLVLASLALILSSRALGSRQLGLRGNTAFAWVALATLTMLGVVLSVPAVARLFSFAVPTPLGLLAGLATTLLAVAWFEGVRQMRQPSLQPSPASGRGS
jgi:hypothetical protein